MKLLLERDIRSNLRVCPKTEFLCEQIIQLQDPLQAWLREGLIEGTLAGSWKLDHMYDFYVGAFPKGRETPLSKGWFSRKIRQYFPHYRSERRIVTETHIFGVDQERRIERKIQILNLGTLGECRQSFALKTGVPFRDDELQEPANSAA